MSARRLAGRAATLPSRPASDEHPLLAAHGGMLTVERLGTVPYGPPGSSRTSWPTSGGSAGSATGCCCSSISRSTPSAAAATRRNLLAGPERLRELGAEFLRIDRGGDITFHGPGQLVAYPIVELRDPLDLRRYVRTLEGGRHRDRSRVRRRGRTTRWR